MLRKKFAVTALSVLLAASLLTACGTQKAATTETTAAQTTAAATETTAAETTAAETTAAATEAEKKGMYKDGTYTAEGKEFDAKSGWKSTVSITVKDGAIVSVDWNGVHKDGGDDKDTASKSGKYGMKAKGGAIAEWHEQAEKVEAFLVEKQDVAAITLKDGGKTDAVSGATIAVGDFVELATEALAAAK